MTIPAVRALIVSALLTASTAFAAETPPPTTETKPDAAKSEAAPAEPAAPAKTEEPAAEETPAVEVHGQFGFGLRLFLDQPTPRERWKFEQYGEVPSGFFLQDAFIEAVTDDGYVASLWATHPGLNNQNFLFQVADPGNLYLSLEWDQTPHLASTKARTLYDISNPGAITIPDPVQQALQSGNDDDRKATIAANLRPVTVNVDRDTAKIGFRYTPAPEWNIKVDYSNEERSGRQIFGAPINEFNAIETLAPIFYTTQNFSANVEYVGKWADDKKFSLAAGYAGSIFENKYLSFTWDNPFRFDPPGSNSANQGRNSLAPDNQAHRLTFTGAIDLPFDSRYVGTFSHNKMTQNSPFIPFTINTGLGNCDAGFNFSDIRCLPARSLNGEIVETLFNNVLTTRFDEDFTSTLRFRHLSMDNKTPRLVFEEWIQWDGEKKDDPRGNTTPGYDKTNASIDLNWTFMKGWKLGGSLGWEHFDRVHADVKETDEYSQKVFVNIKPEDLEWLTVRASYLHAERNFDKYDAEGNVGVIGHPPDGDEYPASSDMRKYDVAKRSRNKAEVFADLAFESGWVITPTASWRQDEFSDGNVGGGELGLKRQDYWSAGVEQSYPVTDEITLSFAYMRENFDRRMVAGEESGDSHAFGSRITDVVDTLESLVTIALADKLFPGDLNVDIGFVYGRTNNKTTTYAVDGGNDPDDQFPNVTNDFQRFDTTLKYNVDPDLVTSIGWEGEATLKLRYAYERNRMTNWQTDIMTPYMVDVDDDAEDSLFLAGIDPNYEASLVTLELGLTW